MSARQLDARYTHRGPYSAWLHKAKGDGAKARWINSVGRRYFTIDFDNQILFYSHSETSKEVSLPIAFVDIMGAEPCPENANIAGPGLRRSFSNTMFSAGANTTAEYAFVLQTRDRRIRLATDREADMGTWVEMLNAAHRIGLTSAAATRPTAFACQIRDGADSLAENSTTEGSSDCGGSSSPVSHADSPRAGATHEPLYQGPPCIASSSSKVSTVGTASASTRSWQDDIRTVSDLVFPDSQGFAARVYGGDEDREVQTRATPDPRQTEVELQGTRMVLGRLLVDDAAASQSNSAEEKNSAPDSRSFGSEAAGGVESDQKQISTALNDAYVRDETYGMGQASVMAEQVSEQRHQLNAAGFGFEEDAQNGPAGSEDDESSPVITYGFASSKVECQRRSVAVPRLVPAPAWTSDFELPSEDDPPQALTELHARDAKGEPELTERLPNDDGSDDSAPECEEIRGRNTRVAADLQLVARQIAAAEARTSGSGKDARASRKVKSKTLSTEACGADEASKARRRSKRDNVDAGKNEDATNDPEKIKRRSKREVAESGNSEEAERAGRIAADLLLVQQLQAKASGPARVSRASRAAAA